MRTAVAGFFCLAAIFVFLLGLLTELSEARRSVRLDHGRPGVESHVRAGDHHKAR